MATEIQRIETDTERDAERDAEALLRMKYRIFAAAFGLLLAVTLLSYAFHWSWTGFGDNGTVWDWLNLFLLPIALGLVPVVFAASTKTTRLMLVAFVVPLTVLLIGGYGFGWKWTGFQGNTLWDWLHLLLVPIALPIAVRTASDLRTRREKEQEESPAAGVPTA